MLFEIQQSPDVSDGAPFTTREREMVCIFQSYKIISFNCRLRILFYVIQSAE